MIKLQSIDMYPGARLIYLLSSNIDELQDIYSIVKKLKKTIENECKSLSTNDKLLVDPPAREPVTKVYIQRVDTWNYRNLDCTKSSQSSLQIELKNGKLDLRTKKYRTKHDVRII